MALVATGRSRSIGITLNAKEELETGLNLVVPGDWYHAKSGSSAWGSELSLFTSLDVPANNRIFVNDPTYGGPGVRGSLAVFVNLSVSVEVLGVVVTTLTSTHSFQTGAAYLFASDPGSGFGNLEFTDGEVNAQLTIGIDADEYLDEANITPLGRLVEIPNAITATLTCSGTYEIEWQGIPTYGTVVFNVPLSESGSWSDSWTPGTEVPLSNTDYRHGLSFDAVKALSNSLSISGDGLSFTEDGISVTAGTATLSGSAHSATFSKSTDDVVGTATCAGSPDWAIDATVNNYDYETGSSISVDTEHYCGTELISSGSGAHEFPGGGALTAYAVATVNDGTTSNSVTSGPEILRCGSGGNTSLSNTIRVEEDWADDYGTCANSQAFETGTVTAPQAICYQIECGPHFEAGTIELDDTHRFAHFAAAANTTATDFFFLPATTPIDDGGAVKFFAGTRYGISSLPFRPFGFRFYRIRVKASDPNLAFRVRFRRKMDNIADGANQASYFWDFTTGAADTWAEYELDLCFADEYFDARHFSGDPTTAHMVHPVDYSVFPDDSDVSVILDTSADWWVDWFDGFRKDDGSRIPVLLTGPHQTQEFSTLSSTNSLLGLLSPNVSLEGSTCIMPAVPSTLTGGRLMGRVVVNGALGFNLNGGTASVEDALNTLAGLYDSTAKDTGIHITVGASPFKDAASSLNGWETETPLWREVPADTAYSLQAVPRNPLLWGYYGAGDLADGDYDPTLTYYGDKVWNGEIIGNANDKTESKPSAIIKLVDNDTGSVLETVTANKDGLVRIFHKYGTARPFSNVGVDCAAKQQWSGTDPDDFTWTTLGKTMNAYWVQGPLLLERDGSDYADRYWTRDLYPILDRYANWQDWETDAAANAYGGVEMAQLHGNGWLFVASQKAGVVTIWRSLDAGATWTPNEISSTAREDSAPTLMVTPHDDIFCWWHDEVGESHATLTTDMGETWLPVWTQANQVFPRAVWVDGRTLFFSHDDASTLSVYASDDYAESAFGSPLQTWTAAPARVSAGVDRHGFVHLVYAQSLSPLGVSHDYSPDGGQTWPVAATALQASATQPAHAIGTSGGFVASHKATGVEIQRTDETNASAVGAVSIPGDVTFAPDVPLGAIVDRRDDWYVAGYDGSGDVQVRYSSDLGGSWDTPSP